MLELMKDWECLRWSTIICTGHSEFREQKITMPYIKDNLPGVYDEHFGDVRDFTSGPAEFLDLIHNAALVVTDSFHASVFSIQFHTPFYALARLIEGETSTNRRIIDLLDRFALQERYITLDQLDAISEIEVVDFNVFENEIPHLRKCSEEYLRSIVGK